MQLIAYFSNLDQKTKISLFGLWLVTISGILGIWLGDSDWFLSKTPFNPPPAATRPLSQPADPKEGARPSGPRPPAPPPHRPTTQPHYVAVNLITCNHCPVEGLHLRDNDADQSLKQDTDNLKLISIRIIRRI